MRRVAVLLFAFGLLLAACGSGQKVGSEKLLQFEEQKGAQRLGEATEAPVASPGSLTVTTVTPRPSAPPTPTPAPQYFDVALVADSPFYEPGNAMVMAMRATLRVTNKDGTPERVSRSFTDSEGAFDSGLLKPGQTWTHKFDQPGKYTIVDKGLTFGRASFEVR